MYRVGRDVDWQAVSRVVNISENTQECVHVCVVFKLHPEESLNGVQNDDFTFFTITEILFDSEDILDRHQRLFLAVRLFSVVHGEVIHVYEEESSVPLAEETSESFLFSRFFEVTTKFSFKLTGYLE